MTPLLFRRILVVGTLLLASIVAPTTALADGPLDDGLRFHLSGVLKSSATGMSTRGGPGGSFGGPTSPAVSNRIGISTGRVGGWTTLGFSRSGVHLDGNNTTARTIDIGLGTRYLFREPGKAKPAPYIYGQGVLKRAAADTDSADLNRAVQDFGRYSLSLGAGGEVAISKGLSLSAEVGLSHDVVNYDEGGRFMAIRTAVESGFAANVYF
ncbi:MAG: hypothetical protein CL927_11070 [Deltaproteobacteria bacterium]|nr:hypothetical protein [Deltaproteobacteria bacterium]HCH63032.1 hypothetical protein [Deltaproteobacteria bacterium]